MAHSANEVSAMDESGSSGTIIEIKIKTMDSQTYTLQVDKQMPVPALKERIASVTGVVTEHQRLICRGKVLKDDQLLSAYQAILPSISLHFTSRKILWLKSKILKQNILHVEDGHTLHMVVREPTASSSGSLPTDTGHGEKDSDENVVTRKFIERLRVSTPWKATKNEIIDDEEGELGGGVNDAKTLIATSQEFISIEGEDEDVCGKDHGSKRPEEESKRGEVAANMVENAKAGVSIDDKGTVDQSSSGNHGQYYQVAPGIVVETFNMPPGQGDRVLPDVNRIISAVLGSMGVTNPGNGNVGTGIRGPVGDRPRETPILDGTADTTLTPPEQSGMRSSNDGSRLHNTFGIPAGLSFGSLQAPLTSGSLYTVDTITLVVLVIPDSLATLSQYLSHMRQEFTDSGRVGETDSGISRHENEGRSSSLPQSENVEGLPSPMSLARLLSATRQMLNEQVEECLLQLGRQLENQENMTDPGVRITAQSGALRNGILLQNLGAYFLELGRTVTTLRLGRSPSEAVVNAGPAVFVSSSGPNPLMVQPLPFQPGASFGTPVSGTSQSGSGLINGVSTGFVPRRIDIQIRRVGSSTHQNEHAGTQQSSGQRNSTTNNSGEAPINQSSTGTSTIPSSNSGPAVRILPFRTMMAAAPDLNHSPQDASGGSVGLLYPVLGRYSPSGNLSSQAGNQVSNEHNSSGLQTQPLSSLDSATLQQNIEGPAGLGRAPASSAGLRESISSRTIDINILSAGGIQSDQNSEGQIPPGILQFLRGLFPGGEFQVESVSSQGGGMGSVTEQERTSNAGAQEAEPTATEEGIFLSRMLEQIMPMISQNSGTVQNDSSSAADASHHGNGSTSSTAAEDHEVGTSRREADANPGPNPKRRKTE
uniref:Ubiquitin-like domain-containing protein n=1 Tax=Chenopodium quinoa TaxID=63459 RepID=A0A803N6V1_CHEQI